MPSPIIARADALMRRQHQPGQSTSPVEEIPILTDALEGDDIPTLLDIDTPPPNPSLAAPRPEAPPPTYVRADAGRTQPASASAPASRASPAD